jgi:hypothetical protein
VNRTPSHLCVALLLAALVVLSAFATGCGRANEAMLGEWIETGGVTTSTGGTAPSSAPIEIVGSPDVERPAGAVIFTAKWGEGPGEFGFDLWEQGAPSQNPIEVAAAPDGKSIALLDYANRRVQVYSREGVFLREIPLVDEAGLADVAIDDAGWILVLTYGGSVIQIPPNDNQKASELSVVTSLHPQSLIVDGPSLWVADISGKFFQLATDHIGLSGDGQVASAVDTYPAGQTALSTTLDSSSAATVKLVDRDKGNAVDVHLTSPAMPLDSIRPLAADADRGLYVVMARIYGENWQGTESWCFVAVGPDGTYRGQLLLPLDNWAAGGYAITPDGTLLELRSTKDGVELTEYQLGGGQ